VASLADRLAGVFVLAVLVIAALTGLWWWSREPAMALPAMLAVLVVSCPCALSLATPAALAATSRALLRRGVLLTRGDALEHLAEADVALFDKTGTLTAGRPIIDSVRVNPDRQDFSPADARALAAALEAHSSHPLARAFTDDPGSWRVEGEVRHNAGGLEARLRGVCYRLGTAAFVDLAPAEAGDSVESGVWLGDERGWLARFQLTDPLRPGGPELVAALRAEGVRVEVLSGDGAEAVAAVAGRLDIPDWQARLDPAAKMARVHELQSAGHKVLMVGDGVNDAPVLAAAEVSMTVQGATELAHSAADLILSGESLAGVAEARALARRARRLVRQNLTWAVAYNVLAIPLAVSGHLQPWMAALGMSASSLLVVGNAARVMRERGDAAAVRAGEGDRGAAAGTLEVDGLAGR
jgi:Cu2+-exporting ATPase